MKSCQNWNKVFLHRRLKQEKIFSTVKKMSSLLIFLMLLNVIGPVVLVINNDPSKGNTRNPQVPQFMMDLYNVVADENGYARKGAPDLGKTINCVSAHDSRHNSTSGRFRYQFNLSSIEADLIIRRVELRVFKTKSARRENVFYRTDIVLDGPSYRDIRSVMVSSTGYGWLSFEITDVARRLIQYGDKIVDIDITLQPIRNKLPTFKLLTSTNTSTRALFMVYSDTAVKSSEKASRLYSKGKYAGEQEQNRHRRDAKKSRQACRLSNLTITFSDHAAFGDVMLPRKVNIRRCEGSCRYLVGAGTDVEETYHGVMQNMIKREQPSHLKSKRIRYACCAPRYLQSLLLLRKSSITGDIVMVTLDNAIVETCWCV